MLPIIGKTTTNPAPSNGLFTYGQISIILKKQIIDIINFSNDMFLTNPIKAKIAKISSRNLLKILIFKYFSPKKCYRQ